ncbi:hypothetical protein [Methylorubrum zatmanii]|uniref:Uncharacterized protein n=1 Tax=Methylorubrum zatmanii TaxID=29429 RepID=A0ABW1WN32_9HYPH|nr:hypothetical protein [Methylorubrum zatmanii]MBD8909074.1 hypothetical protein [Methylorubrum zatmanii]
MPDPFLVPVSRRFAASLSIIDGPATSLDLALWLGAVSHALRLEDEPAEGELPLRTAWILEDAAPVSISGRTLLAAAGVRSHGTLVRPFERLAETNVSLGGRKGRTHRLWHGWEGDPIDRMTPEEVGIVSGVALAWGMIHGQAWPVVANVTAMARFRSRFSAVIYLRALAWMAGAGTPTTWKRTAPGDHVTVTIPMRDLARAMGTRQLQGMGPWNAKAFGTGGRGGPVHDDLKSAGILLRTKWNMAGTGARRVPLSLEVRASRIGGAGKTPRELRPAPRPQASGRASSRSSARVAGAPTP